MDENYGKLTKFMENHKISKNGGKSWKIDKINGISQNQLNWTKIMKNLQISWEIKKNSKIRRKSWEIYKIHGKSGNY